MIRSFQDRKSIRFAVCTVLAASLVAGCAGAGNMARASGKAERAASARSEGKLDRAVAQAERDVARRPREASARAALGSAYLAAGRFESAATTFQDAITLGDDSPATGLRLALAHIGAGRSGEALAILNQHASGLPAGDLGLALALAGDTGRGVAVLDQALRSGEETAKLRQNLAYAFALDGRWLEARLMAAQDVPADQLDARIGAWAMNGKPEDFQQRVAALLGTPVRADAGQPVELALAPVAAPALAAVPAPAFATVSGELPAIEPDREFVLPEAASAAPVQLAAAPAPAAPTTFAGAFAQPASLSVPARPTPARPVPAPVKLTAKAAPAPAASCATTRSCTHQIQLGAFASEDNARRASKVLQGRNPELRGHEMAITSAVVNGKTFWRVSAIGFDQRTAAGACSKVRTRGDGCMALAGGKPASGKPGAPTKGGQMMARR